MTADEQTTTPVDTAAAPIVDPPAEQPVTPDPAPPAEQTPDVEEQEGEEIAEADPHALKKLKAREARLKRERDKARQERDAATSDVDARIDAEVARRAEAVSARVTELEGQNRELQGQVLDLQARLALTGRVADVDAAVRLAGTDFRAEDGSLDVDALLERFPILRGTPAATAPDAGGGVQGRTSGKAEQIAALQDELAKAQARGDRVTAVALTTRIHELSR